MSDSANARTAAIEAIGRIDDASDMSAVVAALVEAVGRRQKTPECDIRSALRTEAMFPITYTHPGVDGAWILMEALSVYARSSRYNG